MQLGAGRKRPRQAKTWAAGLQETHMAQFQLSFEHRYGPNDLPLIAELGFNSFLHRPWGVYWVYRL